MLLECNLGRGLRSGESVLSIYRGGGRGGAELRWYSPEWPARERPISGGVRRLRERREARSSENVHESGNTAVRVPFRPHHSGAANRAVCGRWSCKKDSGTDSTERDFPCADETRRAGAPIAAPSARAKALTLRRIITYSAQSCARARAYTHARTHITHSYTDTSRTYVRREYTRGTDTRVRVSTIHGARERRFSRQSRRGYRRTAKCASSIERFQFVPDRDVLQERR